jgi:hypothetical protein
LLSGFVREYYYRNYDYYHFTCDKNEVESIKKQVPRDNDVLEKAKKLLLAIARNTKHPGAMVELFWNKDYPLAYSQNEKEFQYYLDYLKEKGFTKDTAARHNSWYGYITADGWRAIESYKVPNAESEKVFVAMWFNEETNEAYNNGIQPAIEEDCGYKSM